MSFNATVWLEEVSMFPGGELVDVVLQLFLIPLSFSEEVLSAVECGIDIFDSSYPLILYFQMILFF